MKMYRKTTCKGCGYVQETDTTYYLDRKAWESVHTLAFCRTQQEFNAFLVDLAKL